MKFSKNRPEESRTPILDTYTRTKIYMPDHPEVREYISAERKVIYINTAATLDAKITKLIK